MSNSGKSSGYFVIADISGYTKFMAETEIEHAKGVLEGLFEAVIPAIRAPLAIAGFQGDAVFAYAVDSDLVKGQYILEAIERIYCDFADAREKMKINTSCPCRACAAIGDLDLKIVVHHGEYVMQTTGGREELAGRDVITAFRLLKNKVTETEGLTAYGLVTCDAVAEMGLGDYFDANARRTETYEHIGEVEYVIHPLREAWLDRREKRRILVGPEDEMLCEEYSLAVPISPQAAFTLVTRPDLRAQWVHAEKIDLTDGKKGRIAEETVYHCHHGSEVLVYEVVDWRPGEYVTTKIRLPLGTSILETREFAPLGEGTVIKTRFSPVTGDGFFSRLAAPIIATKARKIVPATMAESSPVLERMAKEMREAEPLSAPDAPATSDAVGVKAAVDGRFAA